MPSISVNAKRGLVIILVALAAVTAGGITWKLGHDHDERTAAMSAPSAMRKQDLAVRPRLQWVLDTKRLVGNPVDRSLSFPYIMDQAGIGPGAVGDAPSMLIAAVGHPLYGRYDSEDGRAIAVDSATLVGIDRASGNPVWRRPIGHVNQCSESYKSGTIACWEVDRVIFVDTATGTVRSEMMTDFEMTYADVIGGVAYVSGRRTRGAIRSVVFTAGSPDAPDSLFQRTYDVTGHGSSVAEIRPTTNTFTISEAFYGPIQYRTSVYDLDSGARRFVFDGDVRMAGEDLFHADNFARQQLSVLDHNGVQLTRLNSTEWMVYPPPTSAPFAPAVLDGGVYDPRSGTFLWHDPVLDTGGVCAYVGPLMIVSSPDDQTIVGLDARTGRRVWVTPWRDAYWMTGGVTDGRYYVFGDYIGMHSLDTVTGKVVWTVRLPRGIDPRGVTVSSAGGDILRTTGRAISLWR